MWLICIQNNTHQMDGLCTLLFVFPNVTMHPCLNALHIPNFGSFVHRNKTHGINNPLTEYQSVGWRFVWALFPRLGVYQLENAIVNVFLEVENGFNDKAKAVTNLQNELNWLIQNRKAQDILLAQQGGTCALIHEECCFYVNQSGSVLANIKDF